MLTAILITFLFCNCKGEKDQKPLDARNANTVTVIIDSDQSTPTSVVTPFYFAYPPKHRVVSYSKIDTVTIPIDRPEIITLENKNIFTDSLIVYPGDTIKLKVNEDRFDSELISSVINSVQISTFDSILDSNELKGVVDSLYRTFITSDYSNSMPAYNDYSKIKIYSIIPNFEKFKNDSTSLHLLVENYVLLFDEFKKGNRNNFSNDEQFLLNNMFRDKLHAVLSTLSGCSESTKIKELLTSDLFISDSTILYPNAWGYLNTAMAEVYFKDDVEHSRSMAHFNLTKRYDSISVYFSDKLSKYAKIICLEQMISQGNSLKEVTAYFNKFNDEYGDTAFKDYFESTNLLNLKGMYDSSDGLNLINNMNQVTSLDTLIGYLKDKVVYVDYWASWCAPCRKAMPASRDLHKQYMGEDVVFIYLSIDKNKSDWQNASSIEYLDAHDHNYLVLNHDQSNFTKKLKINTIPRYLLYNKKGELVHQNAPGPDSEEIRELIDNYLIRDKNL